MYLTRESIVSYWRQKQAEKYSRFGYNGKTGWTAALTIIGRQEHEFGLRVRRHRRANLLPVAVVACPVLYFQTTGASKIKGNYLQTNAILQTTIQQQ